MEIYHGGISGYDLTLVTKDKINTLISFAINKKIEWRKWWKNLFIDSGAFSVYNSGGSIDIKEYVDFLLAWENKNKPIICASLDVIGDAKKSLKNYQLLVKRGLNVIPTFHFSEDFDVLKEYVDIANYIGLGALVGKTTKQRRYFLDKVFSLYPDNTKIGFHGFGVTTIEFLTKYPWKSVDSTAAMSNGASGNVLTPWGQFHMQNKKNGDKHIDKICGENEIKEIKKWVDSYNINWDKLMSGDRYGYTAKAYLSAKTMDLIANKNNNDIYKTKTNYLF